ncbi:type IV pilus biogenesis protein PilM [Lignipirellula cremea]|uniref:Competence protein A n=1 Tax=Lignipirellula cremea TaxID=2528010 RepID=A0A518E552_9BACT|nr:hypothetical protein [Lignipirellula cremea]QDU99225.1 Competence protein A [Lignipirellula cremea]
MNRLLGIEWDSREARILLARKSGAGIEAQAALVIDLGDDAESRDAASIGARIAAALAEQNIPPGEAMVVVGRTSIELRELAVPPAPDDELPELVRFQAPQQFSALGDDWPLDFTPLAGVPGEHRVLAAAVSPALVKRIESVCAAAGLEPQRMVLRPFAAASLLCRTFADDACRMMVDLLGEEVDLTVIASGQVVLTRTIRLPDAANEVKRLVGEVRRTMAAAQNQLGGRPVEEVVLCGDHVDHAPFCRQIEEQLSLPIRRFNPFSQIEAAATVRSKPPVHAGRFAPLAGMLLDEALGARHAIDFLHPRRRPEPRSQKLLYSLVGGGVALILLGALFIYWSERSALDQRIVELEALKKQLTETRVLADENVSAASLLAEWETGDIDWLTELGYLSEKFPPPEDAIVTQFTSAVTSQNVARMWLEGSVGGSESIAHIGQSLADERHRVESAGGRPDDTLPDYSVQFKETIEVDRAPPPEPRASETVPAEANTPDAQPTSATEETTDSPATSTTAAAKAEREDAE